MAFQTVDLLHIIRNQNSFPGDTIPKEPLHESADPHPRYSDEWNEMGLTKPMMVGPWCIIEIEPMDLNDDNEIEHLLLVRWNDTLRLWETQDDYYVGPVLKWYPFDNQEFVSMTPA
jgi:hypothetical protein